MIKPEWLQRIEEREAKATSGKLVFSLENDSVDDALFIAYSKRDMRALLSALNKALEALEEAKDQLEIEFKNYETQVEGIPIGCPSRQYPQARAQEIMFFLECVLKPLIEPPAPMLDDFGGDLEAINPQEGK